MKLKLSIAAFAVIAVGFVRWQNPLSLTGVGGPPTGGVPTLNLYLGKTGIDTNRASTAANNNLFPTDGAVSPLAPSVGSLLVMDGEWPDSEPAAPYPNTCGVAHCPPTFTDNNSNTLTPVFTVGNCLDTGTSAAGAALNHGFYFEANLPANTTSVKENHAAQVSNSVWDISNFYNVATTSVVDGSSCRTNQTPVNNTAPNITGTGFTITGTNDLILVAIDDVGGPTSNVWSTNALTVPAGCTVLKFNSSNQVAGTALGLARVVMQCTASPGTFTPQVTIAQTTHDTFTIYAVAFKAGTGGSAPTTGADFHVASQILTSAAGSYQTYPACPAGTKSLVITDDAGSITAVTDSNSDTFTLVQIGVGNVTEYFKLNISIANPNTFTVTLTQNASGNIDLITFHCITASTLDTGFTAGTSNGVTSTNLTTSTVVGTSPTETTGAGNCQGAAGSLVTCLGIPTGTPGLSNDQFIGTCISGTGPILQPTQPAGTVAEYIGPAAIADVTLGDSDDYLNGDFGFHFYSSAAPAQIIWGFTAQQNASSVTCMVTAFH